MSSRALNVVATGCSSGLGYAALKRLVSSASPADTAYRFLIGARDPSAFQLDTPAPHTATALPLDLTSFKSVSTFADAVKQRLGNEKIDVIFLFAATSEASYIPREKGWAQEAIVNHFSQHYLLHLLRDSLASHNGTTLPRIVFVSSKLHLNVKSLDAARETLSNSAGNATNLSRYSASKFVQMIGAKYWKEELQTKAQIVTLSPGFVPQTGLMRNNGTLGRLFMTYIMSCAPFATSVDQGAEAIARGVELDTEKLEKLSQDVGADSVLYLDRDGTRQPANPLISAADTTLWLPSASEMESWRIGSS